MRLMLAGTWMGYETHAGWDMAGPWLDYETGVG